MSSCRDIMCTSIPHLFHILTSPDDLLSWEKCKCSWRRYVHTYSCCQHNLHYSMKCLVNRCLCHMQCICELLNNGRSWLALAQLHTRPPDERWDILTDCWRRIACRGLVSQDRPFPFHSADRFQCPRADSESERRCGTEWAWPGRPAMAKIVAFLSKRLLT